MNAAFFSSSSSNQISSWYNEKNHGLFTYFFLKAIRGEADKNKDKKITYQEVQDYVSDRSEGVPYWAKRLHSGRVQSPSLMGTLKNEVFVKY